MTNQEIGDPITSVHQVAIESPIVHQACGVLMARRRITIDEAAAALFETARVARLDVTELAKGIVNPTNAS